MTRTSLDHHNCSLARTVDIVGDKWSLMIVRDAFYGVRRFSQFKERLGISQAVLSARLDHLVEHGILSRTQPGPAAGHLEYRLTEKGRDLFTTMVALVQWGDRWIHAREGPPVLILDKSKGMPLVARLDVGQGKSVTAKQVVFRAGPGATRATKLAFEAADGGDTERLRDAKASEARGGRHLSSKPPVSARGLDQRQRLRRRLPPPD